MRVGRDDVAGHVGIKSNAVEHRARKEDCAAQVEKHEDGAAHGAGQRRDQREKRDGNEEEPGGEPGERQGLAGGPGKKRIGEAGGPGEKRRIEDERPPEGGEDHEGAFGERSA